jgi:hypothetical protein
MQSKKRDCDGTGSLAEKTATDLDQISLDAVARQVREAAN